VASAPRSPVAAAAASASWGSAVAGGTKRVKCSLNDCLEDLTTLTQLSGGMLSYEIARYSCLSASGVQASRVDWMVWMWSVVKHVCETDAQYRCSTCKGLCDAERRDLFTALPNVLIFHLNRAIWTCRGTTHVPVQSQSACVSLFLL
jgi:uncharacterized UBP type Zn finger protein